MFIFQFDFSVWKLIPFIINAFEITKCQGQLNQVT